MFYLKGVSGSDPGHCEHVAGQLKAKYKMFHLYKLYVEISANLQNTDTTIHRRRFINTKEIAKVVTAVQFLVTLAILL